MERWDLGADPLHWTFRTYGLRDLQTGELLHRCWHPTLAPQVSVSSDGRLLVDSTGAVYELPPRVNWGLLAFGQALLALPLVVFWLWLRSRRPREAGA